MRKVSWMAAAVLSLLLPAVSARADSEVVFVGGASISGDISVLQNGLDFKSVEAAIKNSPLFGARIGTYRFPIGLEGSLVYSPSGLTGGAFNNLVQAKANILYTEANLLLIVLPGPVAPFVTGGVGLHYLDFNVADLASFSKTKFGYNFGGGLKVSAARLALRVDVRDHVTTVGLGDAGLGILGNILGLSTTSARFHNVELSFGVGVRF
jgi:opacity protein-like surface antigen